MITLGLVSGPKDSVFEKRCRVYMKAFEKLRHIVPDLFALNIVFHSPLALKKADHLGMRTGAFSREKMMLVVAITVPENVPNMTTNEVDDYIICQLHGAVDYGLSFLDEKGIACNRLVYHSFVDEGNSFNNLKSPNNRLHLTGTPLRFVPAGEACVIRKNI